MNPLGDGLNGYSCIWPSKIWTNHLQTPKLVSGDEIVVFDKVTN